VAGPVFVTPTSVVTTTAAAKHVENSDVLPAASVAVAATSVCPFGSARITGPNAPLHVASVETVVDPMNVFPSPAPETLHVGFV